MVICNSSIQDLNISGYLYIKCMYTMANHSRENHYPLPNAILSRCFEKQRSGLYDERTNSELLELKVRLLT